eukprot:COSAG02_NODE_5598_length_4199_cov_9.633659_1_plen_629_part_00
MVPFRKTAESTESHLLYGKYDLAGGGARRWERGCWACVLSIGPPGGGGGSWLVGSSMASAELAAALRARYSLTDGDGVAAAAEMLVRGGVMTIEQFERFVPVDHLVQLPFRKGDALKIRLQREQAGEQAEAWTAAAAPSRRKASVGSITLSVKGFDIAATWTEAVVNAANQQSFTEGDAGVSGVLRNNCSDIGPRGWYQDVCYQPKTCLVDGVEQTGLEVAETQVGAQPAGGRLRRCGVQWILHAVGPRWTQYTEAECQNPQNPHFRHIETMIRDTVERALALAAHRGCRTVTVPAISGGIFCHSGWGETAGLQELEQLAAREALVAACVMWMRAVQHRGVTNTLEQIVLVDHPNPSIGRLDLMDRAFDTCFAKGWQAPARTVPREPEPRAEQSASAVRMDADTDVPMFVVTAAFERRQDTELSVKVGELLESGRGPEFETGEAVGGWRRVWRPRAEHLPGWVPMQCLQPASTVGASPASPASPGPGRAGGHASSGGALSEALPPKRVSSTGGGGFGGGGLGFNRTTPPAVAGGAGGGAGRVSPSPEPLVQRLISYGIPASGAEKYVATLAQCAAEKRPPDAYAHAASPKGPTELFDACSLTDLKRDVGIKKGHIQQIAKLSPSPRHR